MFPDSSRDTAGKETRRGKEPGIDGQHRDAGLLDELVKSIRTEDDLSAVMRQLSKGLLERVLEAEMTEHLGHESGGVVINPEGDTRNGVSKKTVKGELGEVALDVSRDRLGESGATATVNHLTKGARHRADCTMSDGAC